MKNSNDLKTFSPQIFGGQTVAGKGGGNGSSTFNDGGTYQSPPFNPNTGGSTYGPGTGINPYPYQTGGKGAFEKSFMIIDKNGDPLTNVHVKWSIGGTGFGTITDANGEATVNVDSESSVITISHMGKRSHIAKYSDLGSLITLQDNVNNLPPVVVGTKPTTTTPPVIATVKKTNWVKTAAIGVGALLLIGALSKDGKKSKGGNGLNGTKGKKRKGAKGKKRKGLREPAQEITL